MNNRRSLLTAALGFALLDTRGKPAPPEVQTVRSWLDNYMLNLSNVDASTWRASFSSAPMLSADGFGSGPTPWRAVQVAACALSRSYKGRRRSKVCRTKDETRRPV
jgi:hypothetical protein